MTQQDYSQPNGIRRLMTRIHNRIAGIGGAFRLPDTDLSSLAQAKIAAVIVTDESGKIAHVSPGFTELTGFTARDVVGQTPAMALHGQHTDSQTVETLRARCRAIEPFNVDILLYAKGSRPVWITSQGQPIVRGGRFIGYVITQTAMSAQHFAALRANAA